MFLNNISLKKKTNITEKKQHPLEHVESLPTVETTPRERSPGKSSSCGPKIGFSFQLGSSSQLGFHAALHKGLITPHLRNRGGSETRVSRGPPRFGLFFRQRVVFAVGIRGNCLFGSHFVALELHLKKT